MKKYLLIIVLFLSFLAAQPVNSGNLVMVRCDKGYGEELLDSPSQIDMSALQQSFNPKVDTIVFVHGFNNNFDGAKNSYNTSMQVLKPALGNKNYIGFYWPSDTLPSFGDAIDNANKTGAYLIYVLARISGYYGSNGRKIHLLSHSLGGRVLLSTLKQNEARYVKWGYCFSFASAVHCNIYTKRFVGTNLPPRKTFVYHSTDDWVLKYFYSLYYWLFDMSPVSRSPEYRNWEQLTLDEKLEYMRHLDVEAQQGRLPKNDFDRFLYQGIQRADEEAMGLIGAKPLVSKVENVNVTKIVDGHTYWSNRQIMEKVIAVLK